MTCHAVAISRRSIRKRIRRAYPGFKSDTMGRRGLQLTARLRRIYGPFVRTALCHTSRLSVRVFRRNESTRTRYSCATWVTIRLPSETPSCNAMRTNERTDSDTATKFRISAAVWKLASRKAGANTVTRRGARAAELGIYDTTKHVGPRLRVETHGAETTRPLNVVPACLGAVIYLVTLARNSNSPRNCSPRNSDISPVPNGRSVSFSMAFFSYSTRLELWNHPFALCTNFFSHHLCNFRDVIYG